MRPNSSVGLGRRTRHRLAASLTAIALLATTAGAQDEAPRLVSHGAQGYSLDANAIPVVQVLNEVGQQAGFTVEAPETFSSQITATLQDVPLDQLLRRVLRDENYIIVYRGGVQKTSVSGDKIDKIFLLSQAPSGGPRPPGNASPLAGPAAGAGPGHAPVPPGRGAPPPPPPGDEEGGDIATRSARARARAEARRTALGDGQQTAAGQMPNAAQMVPHAEDFTPPPIDEPAAPHDVPAVDVPPDDEE